MTRTNVFAPTVQTIDDAVALGTPWLPAQNEDVVEDVGQNPSGQNPRGRLPGEADSQLSVRCKTGQRMSGPSPHNTSIATCHRRGREGRRTIADRTGLLGDQRA
eukprot:7012245-Pyramimonas_sp.AAC.1